MGENKAGLHKNISSIFDGIPIPKNNDAQKSFMPTTSSPDHITSESTIKSNQEVATVIAPPSEQTQPTAKPQPVEQSPPQTVKRKKSDPKASIKSLEQTSSARFWEQVKNKLFYKNADSHTKRQRIMIILSLVLSIVLIFVFIKIFSGSSLQKTKVTHANPANTKGGNTATHKNILSWQIPELYPATLHDPMALVSIKTTIDIDNQAGRPVIKGIVYTVDNPSAIIDGRIVYEGDNVSNATIVKINKGSVEFEMDGKKWTQKIQR